ncbi:MAG: hypothetical protein HQM08_17975 [Candidatus Riflebacteria bacterium]|nr:hypothetical protein [Candidatus Riflebacteria bacterium]
MKYFCSTQRTNHLWVPMPSGVNFLVAIFFSFGSMAFAGPYTSSPDDPLFFLSLLSLPALLLLGLASVALARRNYRPAAENLLVWIYELLLSISITVVSFIIAWLAGAVPAYTVPHFGWFRLYFICAVFYGSYILVLRQWLTFRAREALHGLPPEKAEKKLAATRWWATWPVSILAVIILLFSFLGTLSMLH